MALSGKLRSSAADSELVSFNIKFTHSGGGGGRGREPLDFLLELLVLFGQLLQGLRDFFLQAVEH